MTDRLPFGDEDDPGPPPLSSFWGADFGGPPGPTGSTQPPERAPRRRPRPRIAALLLVGALGAGGGVAVWQWGAGGSGSDPAPPAPSAVASETVGTPAPLPFPEVEETAAPPSRTPTALEVAAGLKVKGRAQYGDYDRALFGQAWFDEDGNGCDTRNDILRRDLFDVVLKADTNGCAVLTGTLLDPYSGDIVAFERGENSRDIEIDHVVPLADAWQKGARDWDEGTRRRFANDPLNLLAVDGTLNQQKSAGDAATWLPPNRSFRCEYAARIVAVKHEYGLWVTPAEAEALQRVLTPCPEMPLPTD